jgi:prepilin-type processing-associated H-X9-DG protein
MKKTITIIVSVAVLACLAYFGVRWLASARIRPHASDGCASSLSQFGKLFQMYAMDHDGAYPSSWQNAYDYLVSWEKNANPKMFVCRRSGQQPGPTNQVDSWCNFLIVPGLTTNSPKTLVHACCRPEHHNGKGANVLFTDGSVCWYQAEEFHKLLKEQGIERPQQRRP